ncbi:MAG: T9SS type A sorting domain-containing protein [Candidatus Cloacimonetes bacterium]|nr:T9SS type A sorting domain-containing protein [Candidatus Cloacimonadota bacterium]
MKQNIFILIIITQLLTMKCFAQDITLNKIVEYPTSGFYIEKDNLCVQDQYLFAASSYGLEIYQIEEDEPAQLISRLPLRDDIRVVSVKENYAYVQAVSHFEDHTNLYQVDISDVNNPYVVDSVYTEDEDGWGQGDIYNDYIIFRNYTTGGNTYYSIYRIPEFEFVQNYYCDNLFRQLNDSLALYRYNGNIFTLYDFSDLENITEIGQVDLTAGGIPIDEIQAVNDTILVCLDFDGIAFWNYSDNRNWQYLSTIYSPANENWSGKIYAVDDFIFVSYSAYNPGMKCINISDFNNPYVVDSILLSPYWMYMTGTPVVGVSNSVFLGTYQKIHQFIFDNGYFEEQYDIIENYLKHGGVLYDNYLYVSFAYGIKIYDISSFPDITLLDTLYIDHQLSALQLINNLLVFIDYNAYSIEILDITDPLLPNVRNEIPISGSGTVLLADSSDVIYYKRNDNNKLYKYSIPEPNDYTLNFQQNLYYNGNGFIYNDHFYYLASENTNGPDLQIYGGLVENDPELISTITDFAEGYADYPNSFIQNKGNIFYLGSWENSRDSVRFYEIGNPTEINYRFSSHHRCDKSFLIDGNYLFASGRFSHIYAYDLSTAYGLVEPVIDCSDYGLSQYCLIHENNNKKYLYHFQSTAFSIYEIEGYGTDPEPEVPEQYFTSCPNPFSTSTTISLSPTRNYLEISQINIYNIKGQLIRELKIQNLKLKINEAVWDGKDESGKEVSSGVYLYKINNTDEHIGKVVKIR